MLNKEWEELFGIEVSMASDAPEAMDDLAGAENGKKDSLAALVTCLNTKGCIDLNWMEAFSGLPADRLRELLEGAIYQKPESYDLSRSEYEGWVLRAQYLSGNIKRKLETARRLNRKYCGLFEANVLALESVLPGTVELDEIGFGIGSPWIPEKYYSLFAMELLGLYDLPDIHYYPSLGQWKISSFMGLRINTVNNVYTYGTKRICALKILEDTLNGKSLKIYDEVPRPDRKSGTANILNENETLAAQEKQELLQTAFREWVRKDDSRIRQLEEIFYDNYACNVGGRYRGSFLELPGLCTEQFTPYPHQKDAVARIILEKDVLLNHKVGSGKTYVIIMGIHERKRLGLSDKNLIVVPNNVLEAFERMHRQIYPQDNILVLHPEDFRPENRGPMLERIRDEDLTCAYMPFSSFERLGMSRQYKLEKQTQQIRTCRSKAAGTSDTWEKNRLEALASRLSRELAEMQEKLPPDEYLAFDELGITTLVVDEAHSFKNITLNTRTDGIVGMHARGSKKCDEMLEKAAFVRAQGGGVVFSTGTPLTNSISDLFVLQYFLQPEQLEFLHLDHFDEWLNNFAARQTGFEVDVDSRSYRIRTRFSSFHNIPELMSLFANVCDFYLEDDETMGLPESDGYVDVVVPKSPEQKAYIDDLVTRTEKIRQKLVRGTEDNLLKVTHDGRGAGLDIRLVDKTAAPDPEGTKVYACAGKVYELWKEYPGTSQLVFCDQGTPKQGFNVYDELKKILNTMGIPEQEIAFVHEAATDVRRRRLFREVNQASVRILIGSTAKLGIGVNVQENLIGIHHLDIPWKPSDIVQREGRLIRQGNKNNRVFRFRYITAGTFDAYSWQLLENKQRFISQFMNNHLTGRDVRDIDDMVLSYAEVKALSVGDPLLKQRIDTSNELERLKIRCRQRETELKKLENVMQSTPKILERLKQRILCLEKDREYFLANREKLNKEDRKSFGEEALEALAGNVMMEKERLFDVVHGFSVILPAYMKQERPRFLLEGISGTRYEADMRDAKAGGCLQRIEYLLMHLDERIRSAQEETARAKAMSAQAAREFEKGNSYTAQVSRVSRKLLDIDVKLNRRENEDVPAPADG